MKIKYKDWNPKPPTLALVYTANEIIDEYQAAGYVLTLRQLYYQFVARGIIENSQHSYKNLGTVIKKGREAGLISWEAIEDRNRELNSFQYTEDIMNPIKNLPRYIQFDRWARQECYMEVWVEKEALGNIVSKACNPYIVPHMSCKGFLSVSEMWRAGMRFAEKMRAGKRCVLIHLGDHDPSGMDMTRDNQDRMDLFTRAHHGVEVRRIALNMDQVDEYQPPPNWAKTTDSRYDGYIEKYGDTSWELDALEPQVLENLIKSEIKLFLDIDIWEQVGELEEEAEELLSNVFDRWDEIRPIIER